MRQAAGMSQEALAERLGRDHATIWRWEHGKGFDLKQASQVAQVFECDPMDLMIAPARNRAVRVTARLQAGVWRPSDEIAAVDQQEIVVPEIKGLATATLYAAEVVGESMNLVYPPGTIVVLERVIADRRALVPNKRYHVEIQRADGLVESTLKKIEQDKAGRWWMAAESTEPQFRNSMPMTGANGEHITVAGRVVWSLIPEY